MRREYKCDDCLETYSNCGCPVYMSAFRPGGSLSSQGQTKRAVGAVKRQRGASSEIARRVIEGSIPFIKKKCKPKKPKNRKKNKPCQT